MAETSRGRVTITLGRSGQVVKREAAVSEVSYDGSVSGPGSKRSVRDRLGYADSSSLYGNHGNKRQRGDSAMPSRGSNDGGIGRDDLRFKLLKKSASKQAKSDKEQKVVDLRDKLEKVVHPPAATRNRQQYMLERKENGFSGRIPLSRSANDMQKKDSLRSSYSSWTLDPLRRGSPVRYASSSRVMSPERNEEEVIRRPITRTPDDIRTAPYLRKEVLDVSRPISGAAAPYRTSATPSIARARPSAPSLGQPPCPPSSNGIAQRSLKMSDDHQTIDVLLHSLGLGKYVITFKAEEVDMTALRQMGENDLKELGIPMGPRKKILLALHPRSK